jgi:hypothetical protein
MTEPITDIEPKKVSVRSPVNQAVAVFFILVVIGFVSLLGGVFVLAGFGYTLLVFAVECFAAAAFLQRGMTSNEIT